MTLVAVGISWVSGCMPVEPAATPAAVDHVAIRRQQQRDAYPEAAAGRFVSLVDFEPAGLAVGSRHKACFQIAGVGADALKVIRVAGPSQGTGRGALRVSLPPKATLECTLPEVRDIREYTLLSIGLGVSRLRDDVEITLVSDAGSYTGPRTVVPAGFSAAEVDLTALAGLTNFDPTRVSAIHIRFASARAAVELWLDDILLVDNTRTITPTPPGLVVRKRGQNYKVQLPGWDAPILVTRGTDGFWRLGAHQASVVALASREVGELGYTDDRKGRVLENLLRLGKFRMGQLTLLEANAHRVRFRNTWNFPNHSGEWYSQGARRLAWDYTFYGDGRWVTSLSLNNAGGPAIGALGIYAPLQQACWSHGGLSREAVNEDFVGPVGEWHYLQTPYGDEADTQKQNYLRPALLDVTLGEKKRFAPGDTNRDGFDESQGCYVVAAHKGQCRFQILPPPGGLIRPMFRIPGPWAGTVLAHCEGLALRDVVILPDGSALFGLSGVVDKPTAIEVRGQLLDKKLKKLSRVADSNRVE